MTKKKARFTRRSPSQSRARDTVAVILEAAARILEEAGPRGLTTNKVAERAGVSVGSLYEYFPRKEAILVALARDRLARDKEEMTAAIATSEGEVASVVRAVLALHRTRPKVRRATMATHRAEGLGDEHRLAVEASVAALDRADPRFAQLDEMARFVLVQAVLGVARAAQSERPELLEDDALAAELTRLVLAFYVSAERDR